VGSRGRTHPRDYIAVLLDVFVPPLTRRGSPFEVVAPDVIAITHSEFHSPA